MLQFLTYIFPILTLCLFACTEEEAQKPIIVYGADTIEEAFIIPEKITSIIANEQGIETIPDSLDSRFVSLTQISFSKNKIKEIPKSLTTIPNLISLHLNENKITRLPVSITQCKKLTTLTVNFNQITELPNIAFHFAELGVLHLNSNQLESLPSSFTKSRNLTQLSVAYNPIKELPEDFGNLHHLKVLVLAHTELEKLPASFYKLHRLLELDVRGTKLSKDQVIEIKDKLPNCNVLSDFDEE